MPPALTDRLPVVAGEHAKRIEAFLAGLQSAH
jgi:hypothetical protein